MEVSKYDLDGPIDAKKGLNTPPCPIDFPKRKSRDRAAIADVSGLDFSPCLSASLPPIHFPLVDTPSCLQFCPQFYQLYSSFDSSETRLLFPCPPARIPRHRSTLILDCSRRTSFLLDLLT